jgi:hypothetical protein
MPERVILTWTERRRGAQQSRDRQLPIVLPTQPRQRTITHEGHTYEYTHDKQGVRVFRDTLGWQPREV